MSWAHRKGTVSAATQNTRAAIGVSARLTMAVSRLSLAELLGVSRTSVEHEAEQWAAMFDCRSQALSLYRIVVETCL